MKELENERASSGDPVQIFFLKNCENSVGSKILKSKTLKSLFSK
jgi:hypothetical protein